MTAILHPSTCSMLYGAPCGVAYGTPLLSPEPRTLGVSLLVALNYWSHGSNSDQQAHHRQNQPLNSEP